MYCHIRMSQGRTLRVRRFPRMCFTLSPISGNDGHAMRATANEKTYVTMFAEDIKERNEAERYGTVYKGRLFAWASFIMK